MVIDLNDTYNDDDNNDHGVVDYNDDENPK